MDLINEAIYEERVKAWFSPSVVAAQGKSAQPAAGSSSSSNSIANSTTDAHMVYKLYNPSDMHGEATLKPVTITANRPFNFWKGFWDSFKSGLTS